MAPITRRQALGVLASSTATLAGAPAILGGRFRLFGQQGAVYSARAIRLVEETVVIDMLNQFRFPDFADKPPLSQKWMSTAGSFVEKDWEQYRTSGIDVFGLGTVQAHSRRPFVTSPTGTASWRSTTSGSCGSTMCAISIALPGQVMDGSEFS